MTYTIDNEMSIYIPRVDLETNEEDVKFYFENWLIGKVSNVDFVQKPDQDYYHLYVHFDYWFDLEKNMILQNKLNEKNKSVKISFTTQLDNDDEDFSWFLLKNNTKKNIPNERKPIIDLGDLYPVKKSLFKTDAIAITTSIINIDYIYLLVQMNKHLKNEFNRLRQYIEYNSRQFQYEIEKKDISLYITEEFDYIIPLNYMNISDKLSSDTYALFLENENKELYNNIQYLNNIIICK